MADAGVPGWWRGYFAGRAAPMGVTDPSVVIALFANFVPVDGSSAACRRRGRPPAHVRCWPPAPRGSRPPSVGSTAPTAPSPPRLEPVLDLLDRAADHAPLLGRPLAAAWAHHRGRALAGPR